ncbi:MAG: DUF305 domain-containing protein [Vicinamibacterales bacterium]
MTPRLAAGVFVVLVAAAGCQKAAVDSSGPQTVRPGAPGQATAVVSSERPKTPADSPADVQFMQGMIHHHAQALDMTDLIPSRTTKEDMQLLGKRISISQTDEIKMMQRWLQERGQDVPSVEPHTMGGMTTHGMTMPNMLMPGMLTQEEMEKLAAAKGAAFERLFLEGMIKHHEGALTMVKELFSKSGAAQDSAIFAFASDVEADQLIEIRRMRGMLAAGR